MSVVPLILKGLPNENSEIDAVDIVQKLNESTNWFLYYSSCKIIVDSYGYPMAFVNGVCPADSVIDRLITQKKSLILDWREHRVQVTIKAQLNKLKDEQDGFALEYDGGYLGNLIHSKTSFVTRFKIPNGFIRHEVSKYQKMSVFFKRNSLFYKIEYAFKNIPERLLFREHTVSGYRKAQNYTLHVPIGIIPLVFVQNVPVGSKEWSINKFWSRLASQFLGDTLISKTPRFISDYSSIPSFMMEFGRCDEHEYDFKLQENGSNTIENFRQMTETLESFGVAKVENQTPINRLVAGSLKPYPILESKLEFSVMFLLLSIINQFIISEFDITKEFIEALEQMPADRAQLVLEAIRARKKKISDYQDLLKEFQSLASDMHFQANQLSINHRKIRKVIVTPTKVYLSGPQLEMTNRIIRTYKHKTEQFIRVTFADEDFQPLGHDSVVYGHLYRRVRGFLDESIDIAGTDFEFLHYSNSQLRTSGCWFFSPDDQDDPDSIRMGMGEFSDIKNPAKYGSRMAQCFSSTTVTGSVKATNVVMIPDVERNGNVFSDGVGRVGMGIAAKMIRELKRFLNVPVNFPSAYQFRMGGCKGVLTVDTRIPKNQIQIRPSQKKFESKHYAIEVCRASFYSPGYLNRQVITLLESCGIQKSVFVQLTNEMIANLQTIFTNSTNAKRVLLEYQDEYGVCTMMQSLIDAGFYDLDNPYLMNLLRLFYFIQIRDLKLRTRLFVKKSCMLIGVMDETGNLPENTIFVQITDPTTKKVENIVGQVIVNKSPCLHPGDVQKVQAVSIKEYPELAHLTDVVVFSQNGSIPLPMMIAGGDLDGDIYLIIWDQRLVEIKQHKTMDYSIVYELQQDEPVEMDHVKEHFINYLRNNNLGTIANAWIAISDQSELGALDRNAMKLAELHSQAVDFPKKGIPVEIPKDLLPIKLPDFMEKKHRRSYESQKAIGLIYRSVALDSIQGLLPQNSEPLSFLLAPGMEAFEAEAISVGSAFSQDFYSLMRLYAIESEYELISGYIIKVSDPSLKKRPQDIKDQLMETVAKLNRHYRSLFYTLEFPQGVEGVHVSPDEPPANLCPAYYSRASAWYNVTFARNKMVPLYSEFMDDTEELAKQLRALHIHDSLDAHPNQAFVQLEVPQIPVSFGWLMYDILCMMSRRK